MRIPAPEHPPRFVMSLVLAVPVTILVVIWMTDLVEGFFWRFVWTGVLFYGTSRLIDLTLHIWRRRRESDEEL